MNEHHEKNGIGEDVKAELARLRADLARLTEERDGYRKSLLYILRKNAPPFDPADCIPSKPGDPTLRDLLEEMKRGTPK